MDIKKLKNGRDMTVELIGRLDTVTAPKLDAQLKSEIDDTDNLVFDFSSLDYVSSAGLRLLLALHKAYMKKGSGSFKIIGVDQTVKEIFEITGFSEILNYEEK